MTWTISPTITVNGTAYVNNAVGAVSIDYGRTAVWDPQKASYANIKLVNTNNTSFGIDINNSVVVKVRDATNTADITVFTGVVTSVANEVGVNTGSTIITYITITAVGPITVLSRTQSGLVDYPSENESARISRILAETPVSLDTIDTGTYTLLARTAKPADALSLCNAYANTATGCIYETTEGKVGYASELRRNQDVAATGYFSINPTFINGTNLRSQTNQGDVINNVKIGYNAGSYVSVISTASTAAYGTIGGTLDTDINNDLDATTLAGIYIGMRAYPKVSLSAVEVRIDDPDMDATTLNKMLNTYFGLPVSLAGLPLSITPTTYEGFVEGWNLSFSQLSAKITLRTTEKTYSYRSTQWEDVAPALIWSAVGAALTWNTYD